MSDNPDDSISISRLINPTVRAYMETLSLQKFYGGYVIEPLPEGVYNLGIGEVGNMRLEEDLFEVFEDLPGSGLLIKCTQNITSFRGLGSKGFFQTFPGDDLGGASDGLVVRPAGKSVVVQLAEVVENQVREAGILVRFDHHQLGVKASKQGGHAAVCNRQGKSPAALEKLRTFELLPLLPWRRDCLI